MTATDRGELEMTRRTGQQDAAQCTVKQGQAVLFVDTLNVSSATARREVPQRADREVSGHRPRRASTRS